MNIMQTTIGRARGSCYDWRMAMLIFDILPDVPDLDEQHSTK